MKKGTFRFGDWLVDPLTNSVERSGERRQMEPRAMDVLEVLCNAGGNIVTADELLTQCWGGAAYGDNPVHKTLTQLRRVLGDTASAPSYIETIRKRGYRTLAPVDLLRVASRSLAEWRASSPFRGLQAFDEAHAPVFFGRDEATRQLARAVQAQADAALALQLVLGASGCGKTSLVRAGLFPALALHAGGSGLALLATSAFDVAELEQQSMLTALGSALLDLQWADDRAFAGASAVSLGALLKSDGAAVVRELQASLARQAVNGRQLRFGIFIDRFEALFDAGRIAPAERLAFLDVLEGLARSDAVLLLIACRNDFYPHLALHPILMEGKPNGAHFDLAPPAAAEIAQIIRLPAAAAGLSFGVDAHTQARLDDVLCASAAASPDALPLLQYCLQELYRLKTDDGELSFEAYARVGGVEGAIAQRAEQVVGQFDEAQKASLAHVMSLVVVLSPNEEKVTSHRAPWSALRNETERRVVEALVESRLLVSDLMGQEPGFGIAHEAILRRWPRMRDWIETHRDALLVRARLMQLSARWAGEGRGNDLLLPRGRQLDAAKALQEAAVFTLSADALQFIHLSSRRVRLRDRLRMLALSTIIALAVLAAALGISATGARRLAEQRRIEAEGLLGYMLGDFADKLRPLGRLDLLDGVSTKALEYLGGPYDSEASAAALIQRAKALQVIGEVRRAHGDTKAAMEALAAANAILQRQFARAPTDTEVLKNLGVNAYWLGQLSRDRNEWHSAAAFWRQYQGYSDRLHALEPDKVEWWVEQSYAHNNLGSLAATRGDAAGAAREFRMSIALKQRALDRTPGATMVAAELADSYSWLASATEALGELDGAAGLYAREMEIIAQLRRAAPRDALWVKREARALQHRAANGVARGLDRQALADYRAARLLFIGIIGQDDKNRTWQGEVANLELEQQRLAARTPGDAGVVASASDIHARLAALLAMDTRNVNWARREAIARLRMADGLIDQQRWRDAREQAGLALQSLAVLYADNRSNQSIRLATVDALLLSAKLAAAMQDSGGAESACDRAAAMIKDGRATLDYQILDPWVRVNYCLGHQEIAAEAAERLRKIGYRNSEYLLYLSNQTRKNPS